MKTVMINPYDTEKSDYRSSVPTSNLSGIYLHGQVEQKNGFDICGIVGEPLVYDGIYPCEVLGIEKNATLFYWSRGKKESGLMKAGLIVANDDLESYADAQKKYNQREMFI